MDTILLCEEIRGHLETTELGNTRGRGCIQKESGLAKGAVRQRESITSKQSKPESVASAPHTDVSQEHKKVGQQGHMYTYIAYTMYSG